MPNPVSLGRDRSPNGPAGDGNAMKESERKMPSFQSGNMRLYRDYESHPTGPLGDRSLPLAALKMPKLTGLGRMPGPRGVGILSAACNSQGETSTLPNPLIIRVHLCPSAVH